MSDDEAWEELASVAELLASYGFHITRERLIRIADWIGRRPMEGTPRGECNRGDKRVTYRFCTFRYIDRMNNWVDDQAQEGFLVEWVNSYHNVKHGEIEHLVCMGKEDEQRELVERNTCQ